MRKRPRLKADLKIAAAAEQQHPPSQREKAFLAALENVLGYDVDEQDTDEDRQTYLTRLAVKVNDLSEEDYDALPQDCQNWFNDVGDALNAGLPAPDFPGARLATRAERQHPSARDGDGDVPADDGDSDHAAWLENRLADFGITKAGKKLLRTEGTEWCQHLVDWLDYKKNDPTIIDQVAYARWAAGKPRDVEKLWKEKHAEFGDNQDEAPADVCDDDDYVPEPDRDITVPYD